MAVFAQELRPLEKYLELSRHWISSLDPPQRQALSAYQRGAAYNLNRALWAGEHSPMTTELDSVFGHALPAPQPLYRRPSLGGGKTLRPWIDSLRVGQLVVIPSFLSASETLTTAIPFLRPCGRRDRPPHWRNVILELHAPLGCPLGALSPPHLREQEWLLPRGSRFRVLEREQSHLWVEGAGRRLARPRLVTWVFLAAV